MSLPAPLPGSSQVIPATSLIPGLVHQPHGDSSALFKVPIPEPQMVTQDIHPPQVPHTPGVHSVADRMASFSIPQPQRISSLNVPQTPRTETIKSPLEQQNFEFMKDLQQKNQEQMRDISAQLQTGFQQSMEQMFNSIGPPQTAPPPQASSAQQIVLITPVSALPQAAKTEEQMDSAPSQPTPEIKKGISRVKGSSTIVSPQPVCIQTTQLAISSSFSRGPL